jgi:predicted nucleotidyltransferase
MALQRYEARCAERRRLLDEAAARVVAVCRSHPEVHAAYTFGSYARGGIGPHSDLDVLIVRDTDLGIVDRVADLAFELRGPIRIDLVVVTPEEWRTTFPGSSFGRTVLSEAKQIHAA